MSSALRSPGSPGALSIELMTEYSLKMDAAKLGPEADDASVEGLGEGSSARHCIAPNTTNIANANQSASFLNLLSKQLSALLFLSVLMLISV